MLHVVLLCIAGSSVAAAQLRPEAPKEEELELVDPYTKGEPTALDKAGYVSFGPFRLADQVRSQDVEETLGAERVLWVETAHFRIGSTLRTYKFQGDQREEKRIKEELERLKPRFERFPAPRGKLDPWLRLHLFALRLEELYTRFQQRFGLADADFDPRRRASGVDLGPGPYLGMPHKFVVLLWEKDSGVGRFSRRYAGHEAQAFVRWQLPGAMVLCASAESVRNFGHPLESTFTCLIIGETTHILLDGFRNAWAAAPQWLRFGLASTFSRELDPRWAIAATGVVQSTEGDEYRWEPRVARLVANGFVKDWEEMLGWVSWRDISAQDHMLAWSRVSWLTQRKEGDLRAFLTALCVPVPNKNEAERAQLGAERTHSAAASALGKSLPELDREWRAWVARNYPK